jgi:predicted DNA-binding transcriptional regulator AlpA
LESIELLDVPGLAARLKTTPGRVYTMRYRNELPPAIVIGKTSLRWRVSDVERWLEAQTERRRVPA